jgi:hypothetical protein
VADGAGEVADERAAADEAGQVFVRALDLPTASLNAAREAVRLQLDILSPMPAEATVASVQMRGPEENGQTRFAVGMAPAAAFEADGPASLYLSGDLDGESLLFKFDNPHRLAAQARGRRETLNLVGVSGLCLALVLGAVSLRLDQETGRAQARLDATQDLVRQVSRQKRMQGDARRLWDAVAGPHHARMTACAFETLAAGGGDAVSLTDLSVEGGVVTAGLSRPLSPQQVQAYGGLGVRAAPGQDDADQRRVLMDAGVCR